MKMEEYKQIYDKMVISQEADDRILRELLEERGIELKQRKCKVGFAGVAILTAAAAVALFFALGGTSLWKQKPTRNHPGTEMAAGQNRASEEPDGAGGEGDSKKQGRTDSDVEEGDGKEILDSKSEGGEEKEERWEVKDSGEPKKFQVQSVSYPVYDDDMYAGDLPDIREGYLKNLLPFYEKAFQNMLTGKKGKNQVCSPINLYFTMAMLSEMTAGESREQLIKALGQTNGEEVRKQSQSIWQWLYYTDSEDAHCILGNSLWTRQGDSLKKETLQSLSDYYYASTYQGQMGSTSYDQTIQKWLNKMTGGNLRDSVGKLKTTEDTSLVLLSAADFYGTWINRAFNKGDTGKGTFYTDSGKKVTCDFMKTTGDHSFFDEKRFTATSLELSGGQEMYIFLPKENSSVEELLQEDIADILHISSTGAEEDVSYIVNLKLPKFKIKGERDLISTMKAMGVTDIFSQASADFTGLLEEENGCYVCKASQAMQISVDEEGCSVSAYSEVVGKEKGAAPDKKRTISCDRPFLIVISDRNGVPIFAGAVNDPK